jgi:phosphoribosylaminoimidazole carboxylase PurE protein
MHSTGPGRFQRGHASGAGDAEMALSAEPALQTLAEEFGDGAPPVAIITASPEERDRMWDAEEELRNRGIDYETFVVSANINAPRLARFTETAATRGVRVIIATAGIAAALPVLVASSTDLPVIGVPLATGPLNGLDTLLASTQTPPGVPVASMGIGGTRNAAVLASRILTAMPMAPPRVQEA